MSLSIRRFNRRLKAARESVPGGWPEHVGKPAGTLRQAAQSRKSVARRSNRAGRGGGGGSFGFQNANEERSYIKENTHHHHHHHHVLNLTSCEQRALRRAHLTQLVTSVGRMAPLHGHHAAWSTTRRKRSAENASRSHLVDARICAPVKVSAISHSQISAFLGDNLRR